MIRFETGVTIERAIEDFFAFVSDPLRFPDWNSAVQSVRKIAGQEAQVGSTYSMERELPSGRLHNELEILAREGSTEFGVRTTSGPTPFVYRYRFSSGSGGTLVKLDGRVELPRVASLVAPLAARAVKRGVDMNLAALKRALEQPSITTRADTARIGDQPQPRGGPRMTSSSPTPRVARPSRLLGSVVAAGGLGLALMFTYVALFTAAFRDPQPDGVDVAVFAPPTQAQQLDRSLQRSAPGVYHLESADSSEAARQAVLDRAADGALVVTAEHARVLTADAGGTATADAVSEGLTRAVTASGGRAEVQDLKPLPDNDSRGMSAYFTTIGVVIGSLVGAILMWLLAPRLGPFARLGALGTFAALAGLVAAATTAGVVDTLGGALWSVAGVTALLSLAVVLPTAALLRWLGTAGIGASMILMLVLGLSSSGGLLSPAYLPGFFEFAGPLLPPDPARDALRAVVYFDGHGSGEALGVLAAWALVGVSGLLVAAGLRRDAQPGLPFARASATCSP